MSEENSLEDILEEVEPNEGTFTSEGSESETTLTKEQLLVELKKTRQEAAKSRVSKKELAEKAARWEEYEKSQLTETEKLQSELEALRAESEVSKRELLLAKIAAKAGLDADDALRLRGETEAELMADAKALAAKMKSPAATADRMRAGARGKPVGGESDSSGDEWIRNLLSSR